MNGYVHLAPCDMFRLAFKLAGVDVEALSSHFGTDPSHWRRVTSNEKYYTSYEDLPDLCSYLGHTLLIDWLYGRVNLPEAEKRTLSPEYLEQQIVGLTASVGHVAEEVIASVSDRKITKAETRRVLKRVLDLETLCGHLAGILRDTERKVARHE